MAEITKQKVREIMIRRGLPINASAYTIPGVEKRRKHINYDNVVSAVLSVYGRTIEELQHKSREAIYREPRQVIMALGMYYKCGTQEYIGELFKKDHATVIHSCKVFKNMQFCNNQFIEKLETIKKLIENENN